MKTLVDTLSQLDDLSSINILKVVSPLSAQLMDLRSSIVKDACNTLISIAQIYKSKFEIVVERIITSGCLLKNVCATNKVISDISHQCAISLLSSVICPK